MLEVMVVREKREEGERQGGGVYFIGDFSRAEPRSEEEGGLADKGCGLRKRVLMQCAFDFSQREKRRGQRRKGGVGWIGRGRGGDEGE